MSKALVMGFLMFVSLGCLRNKSAHSDFTPVEDYERLIAKAGALVDSGLVAEAFHFLESSYAALGQVSETAKMSKYTFFCSVYYHRFHDYRKTMAYADSMLMLVNESNDKKFIENNAAIANFSKGDAYYDLKNYGEAFRYYYIAKRIAGQSLNSCSLSDYSYRLGMVMFKQEHYASAADYFRMSFGEAAACEENFQSFYRKQELLNNTGISYAKDGRHDSALLYYNKALAYIEANEAINKQKPYLNDVARGVVYNYKAQSYTMLGAYDEAERLFKESILINTRRRHDNRDAQVAQINLAKLYLENRQAKKALAVLQELRKSLDILKNNEVELRWHEQIANYYNQAGQPALAFNYLQHHIKFKDELGQQNKSLREVDVNAQLIALENQFQINLLKKDNRVQQFVLLGAVVLGVMGLIIILLVYINAKRAKRNVQALTLLNGQIGEKSKELEETLKELEKQSQEKDRILRVVAHDLRTPLSGIVGLSGIIIDQNSGDADQLHLLTLVKNTAGDALQLIGEILEVAAFNESTELTRQPTDITEVLCNTVELLQFKAAEKNQTIILDAPASDLPILVNREKIARVITNLISNAIKFSPNNEVINVASQPLKDGVLISVKDQGIGIPENLKNKIFNVFTAAKRPGTVGEKSFGLGLSICRQIVEAHNGKLWFESEAGKGTTFYVNL